MLEREEGNNHDKFAVRLLKHAIVLESFLRCFGTSSGTERPSLVKLPIEESVVRYFLALYFKHSLRSLYSKFVY